VGRLWFYFVPIRRDVVEENLRRAFGEALTRRQRRRLARRHFEQMGMYVLEVLRLPTLDRALSEEIVEHRNLEVLERALSEGRGVILAATHIDNVDLAGCSMSVRGLPICVVAKDISWGPVRSFVRAVRERTGVTLIPPRGSAERIKELLAENKVVTLIVDQHLRKRYAIVCTFFGMLASTSPAPARFALETGAPLVAGVMFREGQSGKHVCRFEESFKLEEPFEDHQANIRHNTQRLNDLFEGWAREHPEQWWWMHRRWKVQDRPEKWEIPEDLRHLVSH
jgi:KDO2-lipid IV(A) lauroyltransferase